MSTKQNRRANSFTELEIKIGCDLLAAAIRGGAIGRGLAKNPSFLSLYRKFVKMQKMVVESQAN